MGKLIKNGVVYGGGGTTGALTSSDVVDNLESTETKLPLSANMGKVLSDTLKDVLYVVSFDSSTGTLTTKSADYEG